MTTLIDDRARAVAAAPAPRVRSAKNHFGPVAKILQTIGVHAKTVKQAAPRSIAFDDLRAAWGAEGDIRGDELGASLVFAHPLAQPSFNHFA